MAGLLAVVAPALGAAEPQPHRYGVIIANADYQDPTIRSVAHADRNVETVADLFRNVLGIPQRNMRIERNMTVFQMEQFFHSSEEGRAQLLSMLDGVEDSELYVYYVGHGWREPNAAGECGAAQQCSDGYLLANDTDPSAITRSSYPYSKLQEDLAAAQAERFPEGRVTFFFEGSFSGEHNDGQIVEDAMAIAVGPPVFLPEEADASGIVMFAAAGSQEPAQWDDGLERGLFTHYLAEALYGLADDNGDDVVTPDEVQAYVRRGVGGHVERTEKRAQTPEYAVPESAREAIVLAAYDDGTDKVPPWHLDTLSRLNAALRYTVSDADRPIVPATMEDERNKLAGLREECDRVLCERAFPDAYAKLEARIGALEDRLDTCRGMAASLPGLVGSTAFDAEPLTADYAQGCPPNPRVSQCAASGDPASDACGCLRTPDRAECRTDPETLACASEFSPVREAAIAETSLAPLARFEAANPECPARLDGAVESARETICRSAADAFEADDDLDALQRFVDDFSACGEAVVGPYAQTVRTLACERDLAEIASAPRDHHRLGAFLTGRDDCRGELAEATAIMNERIDTALAHAESVDGRREKGVAREELKTMAQAYAAVLDDNRVRRTERTIEQLAATDCAQELWSAQSARSSDALRSFQREFADACPAEVSEAGASLAELECAERYAGVSRSDAAALTRFVRENAICTREKTRAEAELMQLASLCQERARAMEGRVSDALNAYRRCEREFAAAPEWMVRDMRQAVQRLESRRLCETSFSAVDRRSQTALENYARAYEGQCPSEARQALALASSIQPPLDGVYDGVRGYTSAGRPSQHKWCLGSYPFTATIRNGVISFQSDNRSWRGRVSANGQIAIDRSGITRPPNHETRVNAQLDARSGQATGTLYNGYCGSGYFRLTRR